MATKKVKGLGGGLDSLFEDNNDNEKSTSTLRISEIEPNKAQPRQDFDDEAIVSLCSSIQQHGILQPLVVRPLPNGQYQIVAGERRWRAARMAGLSQVPVIIKELTDKETMQLALIENLQRENLNPVEEALGYNDLMQTYDMTQEQVAQTVNKSRSQVANMLRVLNLDENPLAALRKGEISLGHAKILAGIEDTKVQNELCVRVIKEELSVRALEKIVKSLDKAPKEEKAAEAFSNPSIYKEVELALTETMGRKVKVFSKGDKKFIQLEFYDEADLTDLADKISLGN